MRERILHLADLHIGATVDARLPEPAAGILRDCRDAILSRLATFLARSDSTIGLVLIAGDLFDRHDPIPELENQVRRAIASAAAMVPVITVPGNHDELSYPECLYRRGDWPGVLVRNVEPDVVWHGPFGQDGYLVVVSAAYEAGRTRSGTELRFPPVTELQSKYGIPDGACYLAAVHATVTDYFSDRVVEGERCFRVSHRQVAEAGYHYLALGHVHSSRSWRHGLCEAVYPGPVVGPRAGDPGRGAWECLRVGVSSLIRETQSAPDAVIPTRWQVVEEEIDPDESAASVVERIRRGMVGGVERPTVVRLRGRTVHPNLCEALTRRLADAGFAAIVSADELESLPAVDPSQLAREESLTGYFVREWQAWVEAEKPDRTLATMALMEGLSALGWKEGGGDA